VIVAVASGKGGTGKTTVAVSLALAARRDGPVRLLDCDAEAPNAALFLRPGIEDRRDAVVLVPEVDPDLCDGCGQCAEACEFHAIAAVGGSPIVFPGLCHGCGSCAFVCPQGALRERPEVIGRLRVGRGGGIEFGEARLDVGRALATPVIRALLDWRLGAGSADALTVIDAPPGTACATMEAVRRADVVLLVTEPTPYGLHDLELSVAVVRDALGIPVRIVVNRADQGDDGVDRYCAREGLPMLLRIPFDRRIAAALAEGTPLVTAFPEYEDRFRALLDGLAAEVAA
jgi:MinD superfamily P-loop ATPase